MGGFVLFSLEMGRVDFVLTLTMLPKDSETYQPKFTGDQGEKIFGQAMCEICRRVMEAWREGVHGEGSTAKLCFETDFYGYQLICLWANLAHVTSSRMQEWAIIGSRLWPIVGG